MDMWTAMVGLCLIWQKALMYRPTLIMPSDFLTSRFKTAFEGFEKWCLHFVTWSIDRCGHGACAQNWPLWYCMKSSFYNEALKVMTVSARLQMLWISSQIVSFMTCNWYVMLIFKWCWYSSLSNVDVNDVTAECMHS